MDNILKVVTENQLVGILKKNENGALSFSYSQDWLNNPDQYPLSLSLPLEKEVHSGYALECFLYGLIPENEAVLKSLEKESHISANNAFGILKELGEDVAGAFRFTPGDIYDTRSPSIAWLSETELASKLDELKSLNNEQKNIAETFGRFSLSGMQPKLSLVEEKGRFGIPINGQPSNVILKPRFTLTKGHLENELFCATLANEIGLHAADGKIISVGEHKALVVERYDRINLSDGTIKRVHQEDMCQILSKTQKYQNEGGATPLEILKAIQIHSSNSVADSKKFIDDLAFNWLIGGTDAHAKNYSMLIGKQSQVMLAPLYDVASYAGNEQFFHRNIKMAMSIEKKYAFNIVQLRHWERLVDKANLDLNIKDRIEELGTLINEKIPNAIDKVVQKGGEEKYLTSLTQKIKTHNCNSYQRIVSPKQVSINTQKTQ